MRGGALALVLAVACGAPAPVGPARFANAPPVWRVDDRRDVPVPPASRPFRRYSYHFDSYYHMAVRALELRRRQRALGVNALDEVPDSTWFTNRIGVRAMSLDEIRRGPLPTSPELFRPWTIVRVKTGGTAPGFLIEDTRGLRFLLKLDRRDFPELESGADAIVARLLWAAGYNVPADHVVYFGRDDLRIDAGSGIDRAVIDRVIGPSVPGRPIRGLVSAYIAGELLGGAPRLGVRPDDPNDRIPHERRRDQRGQAALMAWLANTDLKEDNTIDAWQADPGDPSSHYVVHYLVDFGDALGAEALLTGHRYVEHQHEIDPSASLSAIATLGLAPHEWERRTPIGIRGVGLYDLRSYDPGAWKPNTPGQLPVVWADRFDQFWGAKIAIRFTRDQLAAAVAAARFSDPRAAAYLVDMLVARQRRTASYWFARVAPLDHFTLASPARLCFTDLARRHRLGPATGFVATFYDRAGRAIGAPRTAAPSADGRACAAVARARSGYTIVVLTGVRAGAPPPVEVHLADGPRGTRIVGIYRR